MRLMQRLRLASQQKAAIRQALRVKMNLAIRGVDGQIAHGDTFHNHRHREHDATPKLHSATAGVP